MNCDAACVKIIINSGLIPGPALVFASMTKGDLSIAANDLATTASAVIRMYDHAAKVGITKPVDSSGWTECEETREIIEWIQDLRGNRELFGENTGSRAEIIDKMNTWTGEMIDLMAKLVEPTDNAGSE